MMYVFSEAGGEATSLTPPREDDGPITHLDITAILRELEAGDLTVDEALLLLDATD